jgi:hypothetical protein
MLSFVRYRLSAADVGSWYTEEGSCNGELKKKEALHCSLQEIHIFCRGLPELQLRSHGQPFIGLSRSFGEKYKKCDLEEFAEAGWASDGSGQHLAFERSLYREDNKISMLAQAVWTFPTRSLIVNEQQTIVPAGRERA